ncbi:hypothetical protein B0E48_10010 [Rhodanobacter sp. C03]|nr:hypothetical protein B0E48_10010 [Rhodanobacter sp. C03]
MQFKRFNAQGVRTNEFAAEHGDMRGCSHEIVVRFSYVDTFNDGNFVGLSASSKCRHGGIKIRRQYDSSHLDDIQQTL